MTDKRRINGPTGGTAPPKYALRPDASTSPSERLIRSRAPNELRKIFLKNGLIPAATGSAYLELDSLQTPSARLPVLAFSSPALKLVCAVHGPRPLPRSAPFSPILLLSTHVKFAPFASSFRKGHLRDTTEKDLAAHLEAALRGVIIGDRWPKSGIDVVVTILEGEEDIWWGDQIIGEANESKSNGKWGLMTVLASCITVASAAIADAGIDCVDLVSGGVAALVRQENAHQADKRAETEQNQQFMMVLDPCPAEHSKILAACVVGYLSARDEVTEFWFKGGGFKSKDSSVSLTAGNLEQQLLDGAVRAAAASRTVLGAAVKEASQLRLGLSQPVSMVKGSTKQSIHGEDMHMQGA